MVKKIQQLSQNILVFLSRTDLFFYAMLWLMVLLFIGTVNQKFIGLYAAQEAYFSGNIVWLFDFFPMPGGMVTMGVVLVGLCAKLWLEEWTYNKLGTIVIHVAVMMLLFGGFLTARYTTEGNMQIVEGQRSNYISDYYDIEFVIRKLPNGQTGKATELVFRQGWLTPGLVLKHDLLPFEIEVTDYCHNCAAVSRGDDENINLETPLRSSAQFLQLTALPREKEEEANHSGLSFNITGVNAITDGLYMVFEFIPVLPEIKTNAATYQFEIRHKRTYLPFSVELKDFEKQVYSATNMAKSYQSDVILHDGDKQWRSLIQMNEPLRYKGYTFFQSSFIQSPQQETTILAVVKNVGRLFPYISSILLCIGLLIHLFQRVPDLMRRLKAGDEG